jgi:L-ascorbate metabolism protein UlaG (beta-lactamase superfamily)
MSVSITWHGHANFQLAHPACNVLVDPFFMGCPTAVTTWNSIAQPDVVLVTHLHGDHAGDVVDICRKTGAALGVVVGAAEILQSSGVPQAQIVNGIGFNIGGTVEVKGAKITMTEAFHTTEGGAPTGFIVTFPDGFTVYHAGDTGIFANMAVWGELYDIDLALLPSGGVFTMDPRQAALAAKMLRAKAAVPMHWGTFPLLEQSPDAFLKELADRAPNCRGIAMKPGETITL